MSKSKYIYKFIPNQLAKDAFNTAAEYTGKSIFEVMHAALGEENYNKYMVAQDPLSNGPNGEIQISINPEEENIHLMRFESIGMVYRLTNPLIYNESVCTLD